MKNLTTEPLILRAAKNLPVESTPVWIMRQAGRYLPEYQALRRKLDFMGLCKNPEAAAEASMMPLRRFPQLDAAIIFSDIMVPLEAMGCPVAFTEQGPTISNPIREAAQVVALRIAEPEEQMPFVLQAIRLLKQESGPQRPVLGFAGAPFTLAAYAVEGKPSHGFNRVREMLYHAPTLYHDLADKITATVERHLLAQIAAGASMVQLFDTWAGMLSEAEYRRFALPYSQRIFKALRQAGHLTIHYINGGQHLMSAMRDAGSSIISLDWRASMSEARRFMGDTHVLQGNFNPVALFSQDANEIDRQVKEILAVFPQKRGHIFNLGHGIHPTTPIANVERLLQAVKGSH